MVEDHRTVGYGYGLVLCLILVVYNHFKWDTWDMNGRLSNRCLGHFGWRIYPQRGNFNWTNDEKNDVIFGISGEFTVS